MISSKPNYVAVSAQYHGMLLPIAGHHPDEGWLVRIDSGIWSLNNYLSSIKYYDDINASVKWLHLTDSEVEKAMELYHYTGAAVVTLSAGDVCPQQVFRCSPASAVRLRDSGIAQGLRISNACQRVSDLGAVYIEGRNAESECQVFDCGIYSTHPAGFALWNGRADYVNAGIHVDDGARAIISGCVISDCEVGILINGHYDGMVSEVTILQTEIRACDTPVLVVGSPDIARPVIIRTDLPADAITITGGAVEIRPATFI